MPATPQRPLSLALVAMPWSFVDRPSVALGALSAWVRRERPALEVTVRSEYVEVAARIGARLYHAVADWGYTHGELAYLALLYPERRASACREIAAWAAEKLPVALLGEHADFAAAIESLVAALEERVAIAARDLCGCDAVGLTTSFGQLFANLVLARELKRLSPQTVVILGGSTVSGAVGPSLLREYPQVDCVVQGEGEKPLLGLLDRLAAGERTLTGLAGVLARKAGHLPLVPAALAEVPRLDELPIPDYDEYAARAEAHELDWELPLEGSRGCWWDRIGKTGNPRDTCFFCNLNVQWGGYREKSVERVAAELDALAGRYQRLEIFFVDNIVRHRELERLGRAIAALGRELTLFYEMRVNVRPHQLLLLWEAGLTRTQFGIEALSSSLLRRVGKGTSVLQNLQAMRLCTELGIHNGANLIVDFPGSTEAEVRETVEAIDRWARSFTPLHPVSFHLGLGSTVERLRAEFGITSVHNPSLFRAGMPEEVWRRLELLDLEFERPAGAADWSPVVEACARWQARHQGKEPPRLTYRDGGDFLLIEDERFDDFRTGTFEGRERELYLHCLEIRSREELAKEFADLGAELPELLGAWVEAGLMAEEAGHCLALATAQSPRLAARRIRAADLGEERARRSSAAGTAPPDPQGRAGRRRDEGGMPGATES